MNNFSNIIFLINNFQYIKKNWFLNIKFNLLTTFNKNEKFFWNIQNNHLNEVLQKYKKFHKLINLKF